MRALPMASLRLLTSEVKGAVESLDRPPDVLAGDVARDLDRRRGHDLRLDAFLGEHFEEAGRNAWMALHAGTDEADLAEVVAGAPGDAEPVERRGRPGGVGDGC